MLYIIVPTCASYPNCPGNALVVYRANAAGTPTAFTAQDVTHQPSGVGSSASAIDGQNRIHTLWLSRDGRVNYAVFDTGSNIWGAVTALETTGWTSFGQGDEGVGLALDAGGNPHAVWNVQGDDGRLHIHYATRTGGAWSTPVAVDDVALAPNHSSRHPALAFGPDGALWLAWLDGSFNYTPDGTIHVRTRTSAGVWGASAAIADSAMTTIDNGPSLLVTGDGVVHLTFLNTSDVIRYWYFSADTWHGDRQPATQVTHDPSLGPDGEGGVYIYGHGTPTGGIEGHGDNLYRFHRAANGAWSGWTLYATGAYDSSVSTRWAQFFQSFPQRTDILYWADPYPNVLFLGTE